MSSAIARRWLVVLVGFLVGAAVGGSVFWGIGYYGWVTPIRHPVRPLLTFVTLLVLPMSLVAPLAVVRYLGRGVEGVARWGVTLVAYALMVGLSFLLAYVGVFQALGIDTAVEALAFFTALFGGSFGAIAGAMLAERIAEPEIRGDASASWEDDTSGPRWSADEETGWERNDEDGWDNDDDTGWGNRR